MEKEIKLTLVLFILSFSLILLKAPFSSSLSSFLNSSFSRFQANELGSQAYVNFIKSQSGEYDPKVLFGDFHGQKIATPKKDVVKDNLAVLGTKALGAEEKWIEINLSEQRLYAHEGNSIVYNFPVSTGKWAPTPIGEFRIWIKLRYTLMHGGNKNDGTYYYLPNVPYTMYFFKGYGVHGTYWHNNFGHPMSHGCVNLSIPDAEKMFFWAEPQISPGQSVAYPTAQNPGTRVVVHQ